MQTTTITQAPNTPVLAPIIWGATRRWRVNYTLAHPKKRVYMHFTIVTPSLADLDWGQAADCARAALREKCGPQPDEVVVLQVQITLLREGEV